MVPVVTTSKHPRLWARGTSRGTFLAESAPAPAPILAERALIAVVYAPAAGVGNWIESELARDSAMVQTARSMRGLIKALVEDPSPSPNLLIVDLDALSPADLMELHSIRHLGWFGTILALGHVPAALRDSLTIAQTLSPPYVQYQLHDAIIELRTPAPTVRIPVIRDEAR
jgi:hypothetical protein